MQKKHYISSHTSDSPNGTVWRSSSGGRLPPTAARSRLRLHLGNPRPDEFPKTLQCRIATVLPMNHLNR